MQRFPVVATYLGGSQFDPALAGIDAKLRDYSAAALTEEGAALTQFKERFAALDDASLSAASSHRQERRARADRVSVTPAFGAALSAALGRQLHG